MGHFSFSAPSKHQETSSFLMYFREYRKRPAPWNGLDIFVKYVSRMLIFMLVLKQNMLSYSRSALVLSMHSRGIKFQCFLNYIDFKKQLSVTATSKYSWQPIETINCFYYSIYFKDNQLKQINFFYYRIYFKFIKTTGLMHYLNVSLFRMLFR